MDGEVRAVSFFLISLPSPTPLQLGYVTYRRVKGYYSGEEDALDMRKVRRRERNREREKNAGGEVGFFALTLSLLSSHTHTVPPP
jgi:hypothetical protein